ncbi:MAG: hypothetical protein U5K84_07810 [Alkalibacterium sp.]|nr:hypothetical protein [Alkalibacterium sp.]
MKKGITAVTSLFVLSLAGLSLADSQEAEAAAQKDQDQSFNWKWENHDENMRSHMNAMHGRKGLKEHSGQIV